MQVDANLLIAKLLQKVSDLTFQNAVLEVELENLKKGGQENGKGPDGEHNGDVDQQRSS